MSDLDAYEEDGAVVLEGVRVIFRRGSDLWEIDIDRPGSDGRLAFDVPIGGIAGDGLLGDWVRTLLNPE